MRNLPFLKREGYERTTDVLSESRKRGLDHIEKVHIQSHRDSKTFQASNLVEGLLFPVEQSGGGCG